MTASRFKTAHPGAHQEAETSISAAKPIRTCSTSQFGRAITARSGGRARPAYMPKRTPGGPIHCRTVPMLSRCGRFVSFSAIWAVL